MTVLSIEVVSDVVCPWCFLGTKRLDDALATRPEVKAEVRYSPFLLDPSIPAAGVDLRERLRKRYGGDPDTMFGRVESAARASGIPLDFAKVRTMPSSVGAHVLIEASLPRGTQRALARAIFESYFLEGLDVGDPDVLARIAAAHGFEREETHLLATDDEARARIKQAASEQGLRGISGVPFFVLGGRYGLSGAQAVETFQKAIDAAVRDA